MSYELRITSKGNGGVKLLMLPENILKICTTTIFVVAIFNFLTWIENGVFSDSSTSGEIFSIGFLFFGYIFAALGIFVHKKSILAIIISIVFWLIDTIFYLVATALSEDQFEWGMLFISIYFLSYLFKAIDTIKASKMENFQN
jgi:hypothetical protein